MPGCIEYYRKTEEITLSITTFEIKMSLVLLKGENTFKPGYFLMHNFF